MAANTQPEPREVTTGRAVPLRIAHDTTEVEIISLTILPIDTDLDEVRCDGNTIGFVRHVDRIFVALVGNRRDRAEEHGQFFLWDFAAQQIVHDTAPQPARQAA
jgi:hypothetical protein